MRAFWILLVYAAVLLMGGLVAFGLAPEGANAKTALIVPGVCAGLIAACAFLVSFRGHARALGFVGIHLGLLLTLLFAGAFGAQGWSRLGQSADYREAVERYEAGELSGAPGSEAGRAAFLEAQDLPAYDTRYLAIILLTLAGVSVLALVALALNRPRPADRAAPTEAHAA